MLGASLPVGPTLLPQSICALPSPHSETPGLHSAFDFDEMFPVVIEQASFVTKAAPNALPLFLKLTCLACDAFGVTKLELGATVTTISVRDMALAVVRHVCF